MATNIGVLTASRTADSDECYTPHYAAEPLLEFIPKGKTIWCPFDLEWSAFVQTFTTGGGARSSEATYPKGRTSSNTSLNIGT